MFEDLADIFRVESPNCPVFKFALADFDSSYGNLIPWPDGNNTFSLDEDYNLGFDTSELGRFRAKITPLLHGTYAMYDLELRVIPAPVPKINKPPQLKMEPTNVVFDYSGDAAVVHAINNPNSDQSYQKEVRIQLPEMFDPDSKNIYEKLVIADEYKASTMNGLGFGKITNSGTALNKRFSKFQLMDYDIAGRFLIIKFKTINDLINVNGNHPIKLTVSDYEGDKNVYEFNIKFIVP